MPSTTHSSPALSTTRPASHLSPASKPLKTRSKAKAKSNSKTKAKQPIEEDEELYAIRGIIAEELRRGKLFYHIDWADHPVTGESYPPSWEPAKNATEAAVADWENTKKRAANDSSESSSSDSDAPDESQELATQDIATGIQSDNRESSNTPHKPPSAQGKLVVEIGPSRDWSPSDFSFVAPTQTQEAPSSGLSHQPLVLDDQLGDTTFDSQETIPDSQEISQQLILRPLSPANEPEENSGPLVQAVLTSHTVDTPRSVDKSGATADATPTGQSAPSAFNSQVYDLPSRQLYTQCAADTQSRFGTIAAERSTDNSESANLGLGPAVPPTSQQNSVPSPYLSQLPIVTPHITSSQSRIVETSQPRPSPLNVSPHNANQVALSPIFSIDTSVSSYSAQIGLSAVTSPLPSPLALNSLSTSPSLSPSSLDFSSSPSPAAQVVQPIGSLPKDLQYSSNDSFRAPQSSDDATTQGALPDQEVGESQRSLGDADVGTDLLASQPVEQSQDGDVSASSLQFSIDDINQGVLRYQPIRDSQESHSNPHFSILRSSDVVVSQEVLSANHPTGQSQDGDENFSSPKTNDRAVSHEQPPASQSIGESHGSDGNREHSNVQSSANSQIVPATCETGPQDGDEDRSIAITIPKSSDEAASAGTPLGSQAIGGSQDGHSDRDHLDVQSSANSQTVPATCEIAPQDGDDVNSLTTIPISSLTHSVNQPTGESQDIDGDSDGGFEHARARLAKSPSVPAVGETAPRDGDDSPITIPISSLVHPAHQSPREAQKEEHENYCGKSAKSQSPAATCDVPLRYTALVEASSEDEVIRATASDPVQTSSQHNPITAAPETFVRNMTSPVREPSPPLVEVSEALVDPSAMDLTAISELAPLIAEHRAPASPSTVLPSGDIGQLGSLEVLQHDDPVNLLTSAAGLDFAMSINPVEISPLSAVDQLKQALSLSPIGRPSLDLDEPEPTVAPADLSNAFVSGHYASSGPEVRESPLTQSLGQRLMGALSPTMPLPEDVLPIVQSPLAPYSKPRAENTFVVTLPMANNTRHFYVNAILRHKKTMTTYGEYFQEDSAVAPPPSLVQQMDQVFEQLFDLCDLPAYADSLPVMGPTEMMKHATGTNSKCSFVFEFLDRVRTSNSHIVILASPGRTFQYLDAILKSSDFRYARHEDENATQSREEDGLFVTLASSDQDVTQLSDVDVLIQFDHTARKHDVLASLAVLSLVVVFSIEHIDLKLASDLDPVERRNAISYGTVAALQCVDEADQDQAKPHEVAETFANLVHNPDYEVAWESQALPDVVFDYWLSSQPSMRMPQETPGAVFDAMMPLGRKRPHDDDTEHGTFKRAKRDGGDARKIAPLFSDLLKLTLEDHAAPTEDPDQMTSIHVGQLESMAAKISELQDQLRAKDYLHSTLDQMCKAQQTRLTSFERTASTLSTQYYNALSDRGVFEKQYNKALLQAGEADKLVQESKSKISLLQDQIATLEAKLADANKILATSSVADVAQFGSMAGEVAGARDKIATLEKRIATAQNEADYSRQAYQDASNRTSELAAENAALGRQLADLKTRADENIVQIHRIQATMEEREDRRIIQELKALNADRERELEQAREELRVLRNGRRETRQASVPRSPRMGGLGPRNGRVAGNGGGSRGTSPALDIAATTAGMSFLSPGQSNGRFDHLRN